MIILLNEQTVAFEVLAALRSRAAAHFELPDDWVSVRLERDSHLVGKPTYHPVVEISIPAQNSVATAPAYSDAAAQGGRFFTLCNEDIQTELSGFVTAARKEIALRLAGLDV